MLEKYFLRPTTVDRIRDSWLGDAIQKYVTWLAGQAYSWRCVIRRVPLLLRFGEFARRRGAHHIEELYCHLDPFINSQLRKRIWPCRSRASRKQYIRDHRNPIEQFLRVVDLSTMPSSPRSERPFEHWAPGFFGHLRDERGLSTTTIEAYAYQLSVFEQCVMARRIAAPEALSPSILEGFLAERGAAVCARSLRITCAALRTFLRYLFREGITRLDLSTVVEGPCTYHFSDVPRSVGVEDIERTLRMVDRRTVVGRRDYAMLMLLVLYGLRAREVAVLTLDDIDWKANVLHIRGRKAGHAAVYPLAVDVGEAVIDYIQRGRPETSDRRIFFRTMAPRAAITHRIVSHRARFYLRKAGIKVARPGSHTLRHSCAQRLVDAEFSLKVIGDYLGHRRAASTRIYAKVAIEALREVALGDGEAIL